MLKVKILNAGLITNAILLMFMENLYTKFHFLKKQQNCRNIMLYFYLPLWVELHQMLLAVHSVQLFKSWMQSNSILKSYGLLSESGHALKF